MNAAAPYGHGAARTLTAALRAALVCAIALVCSSPAAGQAVELTGGASSLLNAEGGSLELHAQNYRARLDLGYLDRLGVGFSFSRPYKNSQIALGDQPIQFLLPTDIFNNSFYFLSRGLSVSRKLTDGTLFAFAGMTSNGYFAPFFSVAHNDTAATAIFYERQLSRSFRFYSRNIFSQRQTSIQAVEWSGRKDIKMALSAGLGNNQGYWSSSLTLNKRWMALDASYSGYGEAFRRVLVSTPQLTENDRENIRFEFTPLKNARIVVSRNNYLSSIVPNVLERASVQGLGGGAAIAGFQLYGSLFQSSTKSGNSSALALGGRHMITRHFEAGADFLHSAYSKGTPTHSLIGNLREILNSRFSLRQIITHSSGQTSIAFGGDFISNLVSVSVDYQTVFLPFVQAAGGQFKQVAVVGLHFQLPHGVQMNMDTNVTPLGQVRYTAYASTYAYRGQGSDSPGASFSGAFFRNVVRGTVVDAQDEPIGGAALRIGGGLAVTDSEGNFLIRLKKAGELNLQVAFEDFTAPGNYVAVSAPATVKATREEDAQDYKIVLKRVPYTPLPSESPKQTPDAPEEPKQNPNAVDRIGPIP
jgi:hypothetical protein